MRLRAQLLQAILLTVVVSVIIGPSSTWLHARSPDQKATNAPQRVTLSPEYAPGQVIRYQLQSTTTTDTHRGGAIRDPQGPTKMTLVWNAITRLEVLAVGRNPQGLPDGTVRLRSTYEKSDATASSVSYDPNADGTEAKYRALKGKSFEFSVNAAGVVSDIVGFEGGSGPGSAVDAVRRSLNQFSWDVNCAKCGIVIGQSWGTDAPVPDAPISGLMWRSRSNYERNEPCQLAATPSSSVSVNGETCAVILTKLTLVVARPGKDVTPENYRKMGLSTAGTWTGEGDTLSYVSISSGRLVSGTQSSSEQMDFTVTHDTGDRMTYKGSVQSHSQLALLPPTP
jgi:hypothetical protein